MGGRGARRLGAGPRPCHGAPHVGMNASVKTAHAQAMEQIVREIAPTLKAVGFQKSRHRFNRDVESGMVHAVSFQMGPFEPPGTEEIPPFRMDMYGKCTVNLGVFVPEMVIDPSNGPKGWVNEYDCQLRQRLGHLLTAGSSDVWWSLANPEAAATDVGSVLDEYGLTWLGRLTTRSELLAAYRTDGGTALGMTPRAPVEIAWLLAHSDRPAAESVLREYLDGEMHASHREWLTEMLAANGYGHLVGR